MEDQKKKIKIATLYRYYVYAAVIRENVKDKDVNDLIKSLANHKSSVVLFFTHPIGVNLTIFYSYIYLLIEGWRDLKLSDPTIDKLISSPNTNRLRLFRNATFHYQKEPLSPKHLQFFGPKNDDTEVWIHNLYKEFGNYFVQNSFAIPNTLLEDMKGKNTTETTLLIQKFFYNDDD